MTRYELIKQHEPCLEEIARHGLRVRDFYWAVIYEELQALKAEGHMLKYCFAVVAERHGIAERTIYAIVDKMEQDVEIADTVQ